MAGNLSRANELNTGKGIIVRTITVLGISFLIIPLIILVFYSFNSSRVVTMWEGFSLKWYKAVIDDRTLWIAIKNSLIVAIATSLIATTLGTLAALAIGKYKFKGKKVFLNFLYIPMILPELIFGIALLILFITINIPLGLITIIIAHVTFSIPFVAVEVLSKVGSLDRNLEEASMDLGANKWKTFYKVILPQISAGVISGALFAFTMSLDDFVITFFTAGTGVTTLPLKIYSLVKMGITPAINAISSILIVITMLIILSINSLHKIKEAGKGLKRTFAAAGIIFAGLFLFLVFQKDNTQQLFISNFADYLSDEVVKDFEKEYGITVTLDYFNDNEELLAKMKMGANKSDVILATDFMVKIMISEGLLAQFDTTIVPNLKYIDPAFRRLDYDPGENYHIPYTYGYSGLFYNGNNIKDTSMSWNILFDKKYDGRILLVDDMREVLNIGYRLNNYRMKDRKSDQLQAALSTLVKLKPHVKKFDNNIGGDYLVAGEVDLVQNWNGSYLLLKREHPEFKFAVPEEGAFFFVDNFCITANATNRKNAELFLNYILRPEVAAKNMTKILYLMPNTGMDKYLDAKTKEIISSVPKDVMNRLEFSPELGDFMMELEKAWTKLKSN